MALSCPASRQLFLFGQELDSAPLVDYCFSEIVLQPDISKECQKIKMYLTLLDGSFIMLLVAFKSEEELFDWTRAFESVGAKVC